MPPTLPEGKLMEGAPNDRVRRLRYWTEADSGGSNEWVWGRHETEMQRLEDVFGISELYAKRNLKVVITFIKEDVPNSVEVLDWQRLRK